MTFFFEEKQLTNKEVQQIEQNERQRLKIPNNKPLPMGFEMMFTFRLGKVYIDEKVVSACMGLNFVCTLKKHLRDFKNGEYGEILSDDIYNNMEAKFFGKYDGIFGCYKTYNWYLRIDMFEIIINERPEVVTYVSLHKDKANQSELNCMLKEKVQKELKQKEKSL